MTRPALRLTAVATLAAGFALVAFGLGFIFDEFRLIVLSLAIALGGSWNERFQGGTTIQRASIKDLEVPLVPVKEQRDIQLAVLSTQLLHEQSARLAEEAGIVGSALLDAVRYNARLENPEISVGPADEDGPVDSEEAK